MVVTCLTRRRRVRSPARAPHRLRRWARARCRTRRGRGGCSGPRTATSPRGVTRLDKVRSSHLPDVCLLPRASKGRSKETIWVLRSVLTTRTPARRLNRAALPWRETVDFAGAARSVFLRTSSCSAAAAAVQDSLAEQDAAPSGAARPAHAGDGPPPETCPTPRTRLARCFDGGRPGAATGRTSRGRGL